MIQIDNSILAIALELLVKKQAVKLKIPTASSLSINELLTFSTHVKNKLTNFRIHNDNENEMPKFNLEVFQTGDSEINIKITNKTNLETLIRSYVISLENDHITDENGSGGLSFIEIKRRFLEKLNNGINLKHLFINDIDFVPILLYYYVKKAISIENFSVSIQNGVDHMYCGDENSIDNGEAPLSENFLNIECVINAEKISEFEKTNNKKRKTKVIRSVYKLKYGYTPQEEKLYRLILKYVRQGIEYISSADIEKLCNTDKKSGERN